MYTFREYWQLESLRYTLSNKRPMQTVRCVELLASKLARIMPMFTKKSNWKNSETYKNLVLWRRRRWKRRYLRAQIDLTGSYLYMMKVFICWEFECAARKVSHWKKYEFGCRLCDELTYRDVNDFSTQVSCIYRYPIRSCAWMLKPLGKSSFADQDNVAWAVRPMWRDACTVSR